MYRCDECGTTSPPKTRQIQVVVKRREKVYPPIKRKSPKGSPPGESPKEQYQDRGGRGWEIAKVAKLCPTCAARHDE
ncbi:MAG TPA: hypothetical protein VGE52_02185 [Pirellulales bacterium]